MLSRQTKLRNRIYFSSKPLPSGGGFFVPHSMKPICLLFLPLIILSGCEKERELGPPKATAVSIDGHMQLRLMTFNVRHESSRDRGNRAWNNRIINCVRMIRDESPDIMGFQEAVHGQVADLWASLPDYELIGTGRTDGKRRGEYTCILFKRDRFELHQQETFWLSDTPKVPGSKSWGNGYPRVVCWTYMTDRSTGRSFYAYNTHWDHRNQVSREKAAILIAAHIDAQSDKSAPVILMGDFNATRLNNAVRFFTGDQARLAGESRSWGRGFTDTFQTLNSSERDRTTLHFWSGSRSGYLKVDHILVSQPSSVIASGIRDKDQPMVSDHFPVTATVSFPPPED